MGNRKYPIPTIGQRFGEWEVIDNKLVPVNNKGTKGVLVRCTCGFETRTAISFLSAGTTRKCSACHHTRLNALNFSGVENLSGSHFSNIAYTARERGLEFSITKEYIWDLFCQQEQKCALSGQELVLSRVSRDKIQNASLDRIDSNKGYVEGNVQWVHKDINKMKMDLDESIFVQLCAKVAHHRSK